MKMFKKSKNVFFAITIIQIFIILILFSLVDRPADFLLTDVTLYDYSNVVFDNDGGVLNVSLSNRDEWCVPVSLDKMGDWTPLVAISLEDKRFYGHNGLDLPAILRAAFFNIKSGRRISGASTITSQLIRIANPCERTFYNKLLEFWNACKLENILKKDDILELYLNRAPFGGNIRGIEAASNAYFNKSASLLSLGETVTLISMLRSPSRFRPDRFPQRALNERNTKLDYLKSRNLITDTDLNLAKREAIYGNRYPIPSKASMAAMHIRNESKENYFINSTIDSNLQLLLEKTFSDALSSFPITITGAGIIVENSTGFVRAYVGNSRHGARLEFAQVDCGASLRSPGSTLKPFVYAAAFERGLLTPASLLADTPLSFGGSAPRNFDMSYRGPVSARNALASSLNAPAVRTLRMVGYNGAKTVLNNFGFANIDKEPFYYTDSLVLGGCEVNLIQLAAAYRSIANRGLYSPLRWTHNGNSNHTQALSPQAAYLVTNILQDERRLLPFYREISNENQMMIAFKTGTSYGLRDAWTAGYSDNYTVVIWIGSPPGKGDARLVGMETAAPVFLKIMRELWSEDDIFSPPPDGVNIRLVCSLSGSIPNKYCPQTVGDLYIDKISSTRLCTLHRNINGRLILYWPAALRNWMSFEEEALPLKTVKIIRPFEGNSVILQNNDSTERIFLSAEGDFPHYWYINGKFIGISNTDGFFADVLPGTHKVTVLSGTVSDTVTFYVKTPREIHDSSFMSGITVLN